MKLVTKSVPFLLLMLVLVAACKPKTNTEPANSSGQTPYVIEKPTYFADYIIPSNNPMTVEGVDLGRHLFYDLRLSADNTMSCATCHRQQFAFSDTNQFSVGIAGLPGTRQSMALVNLLWQNRFFWDGRAMNLEHQALFPIQDPLELNQSLDDVVAKLQADPYYPEAFRLAFGSTDVTPDRIAKALAQFERTLISADSKYDRYLRGEYTPTPLESAGIELFFTHPIASSGLRGGNCGDCHGGYLTQLNQFHNNGLDANPTDSGLYNVTGQMADYGKFKAPTMRNIALTPPYMHDGRFKTLAQVLDHYNDHIQPAATLSPLIIEASNNVGGTSLGLTSNEKNAIIAFLNMLTDDTFITNPAHANPW